MAIDGLHAAVAGVSDRLQLLPTLSRFVHFLMMLLADPNFKISLSTMQILDAVVHKVGYDIKPYLGWVIGWPAARGGLAEASSCTRVDACQTMCAWCCLGLQDADTCTGSTEGIA